MGCAASDAPPAEPEAPAPPPEVYTSRCGACQQMFKSAASEAVPCPACGQLNRVVAPPPNPRKKSKDEAKKQIRLKPRASRVGLKTREALDSELADDTIEWRRPCKFGLTCYRQQDEHLEQFCHPDDDDYPLALRKHRGKGQFSTQSQCYKFVDPYGKGIIDDKGLLSELMYHLDNEMQDAAVEALWNRIDDDGNGFISYAEFLEVAGDIGIDQLPVGTLQDQQLTRAVSGSNLACGFGTGAKACSCTDFRPRAGNSRICECGHKRGLHHARDDVGAMTPVPYYWQSNAQAETSDWVDCDDPSFIIGIQDAMDASAKRVWTRDRGRGVPVPNGFEVVSVKRNENPKVWRKYALKRQQIIAALADDSGLPAEDAFKQHVVKTALRGTLQFMKEEPLDQNCNEWFLWHGTSEEGAHSICETDFKQSRAGEATGTLYGPGTYFAESCTKADEYAKESTEGEGIFVMLLVRVVGGRVKYTDVPEPDTEELVASVLHGPYDTVLGDREVCRNTFKEFVSFASDQAYPEFIVYYKRKFNEE